MIHQDLSDFIVDVKKEGFLVEIETNGSNPEMLRKLVADRSVDYVALDIKAPLNWERYGRAAGIKKESLFVNVKESIGILLESSSDVDYEFRSTVVPGLIEEEDILFIARHIKGAKRYVLQQFLFPSLHPSLLHEVDGA